MKEFIDEFWDNFASVYPWIHFERSENLDELAAGFITEYLEDELSTYTLMLDYACDRLLSKNLIFHVSL